MACLPPTDCGELCRRQRLCRKLVIPDGNDRLTNGTEQTGEGIGAQQDFFAADGSVCTTRLHAYPLGRDAQQGCAFEDANA